MLNEAVIGCYGFIYHAKLCTSRSLSGALFWLQMHCWDSVCHKSICIPSADGGGTIPNTINVCMW